MWTALLTTAGAHLEHLAGRWQPLDSARRGSAALLPASQASEKGRSSVEAETRSGDAFIGEVEWVQPSKAERSSAQTQQQRDAGIIASSACCCHFVLTRALPTIAPSAPHCAPGGLIGAGDAETNGPPVWPQGP